MPLTADDRAHPWPLASWIDFRFRRGVWALARPWYDLQYPSIPLTALHWFTPLRFWFPFLTIRTRWFHWYLGWKPITLEDPAFPWRDLDIVRRWRAEGRQFVQLSWRWGVGDIS